MLLAVVLGLLSWVLAIGYLFLPGLEYWQSARQQLGRTTSDERRGNQLEAIARFILAVLIAIIGLSIMAAALPAWMVSAIVFGFVFLFAAWWTLRHVRRSWRRFSTGRHHREAILCYVAIPVFTVLGVLLLILALKGISPASPVRSPGGGS